MPNGGPRLDDAADADDGAFQMRVRDNAAIGDDRLAQGCAVNLAARQETRVRVNRCRGLEEAVFRKKIGQVQISLVKCPDRSDVFPVPVEKIPAHLPLLDCLGNDMLPEIDQIVLEAFHQNVAIENVNAHRSLK